MKPVPDFLWPLQRDDPDAFRILEKLLNYQNKELESESLYDPITVEKKLESESKDKVSEPL